MEKEDRIQGLKDVYRWNRYGLDLQFVIRDGKKHPCAIICQRTGTDLRLRIQLR